MYPPPTESISYLVFVDGEPVEIFRHRPSPGAGNDLDLGPLVFLHGWGLSPASYAPLLQSLAAAGFHVLAPALPGFGRSAPLPDPRRDTLSRIVERVRGALEAEGLSDQRLAYAGHSLGAGVAVRIAREQPANVEFLALLCPIGGGSAGVATWARLATGLRHEIGQHPLSRIADALPSFLSHPAGSIATGIAAKHADLTDDLRALAEQRVPMLLVAADRDGIVATDRLRVLRGLDIHDVPGTHGWPLSCPLACASIVSGFAARTVRGADVTDQ